MAGIGKHKLSDAIKPEDSGQGKKKRSGGPAASQARETAESKAAKEAQSSNRDRMVDIGRGNQQAGRGGGNQSGRSG